MEPAVLFIRLLYADAERHYRRGVNGIFGGVLMPQNQHQAIALVVTAQVKPEIIKLASTHYLWIRDSLQNKYCVN